MSQCQGLCIPASFHIENNKVMKYRFGEKISRDQPLEKGMGDGGVLIAGR